MRRAGCDAARFGERRTISGERLAGDFRIDAHSMSLAPRSSHGGVGPWRDSVTPAWCVSPAMRLFRRARPRRALRLNAGFEPKSRPRAASRPPRCRSEGQSHVGELGAITTCWLGSVRNHREALAENRGRLTERRIAILLAGMRARRTRGRARARFEAIYSDLAAPTSCRLYPLLDGVAASHAQSARRNSSTAAASTRSSPASCPRPKTGWPGSG